MNTVICRNVYGAEFPVPMSELTQRMSAFAVIVHDGKLLMTRQWDGHVLPGGGVEVGESLEQAVVRKVYEETGLQVAPVKLQHATTSIFATAPTRPRSTATCFTLRAR